MGTLGGSFGASSLGDGGCDEMGIVVYDAMMTFLVVEFNDITLWLCSGGADWKAPSALCTKGCSLHLATSCQIAIITYSSCVDAVTYTQQVCQPF